MKTVFSTTIIFLLLIYLLIGMISLFTGCEDQISILAGKVICLDPGHGGTAASDSFRIGPSGEREEWINLRVTLFLKKILEAKGAQVLMTRTKDIKVSLKERALLAKQSHADVFLSIHHNATADMTVNFPIVYFHGNASENQASVLLGQYVIRQIKDRLYDKKTKGSLVSDYTIFPGSGTAVLRHSYGIPGVIGEASFFSNPDEENRLKSKSYNKLEADAYLAALMDYFYYEPLPINGKFSRVQIPPFPVLQEAERMDPIALLWKSDFARGKHLLNSDHQDSLNIALDHFTRSVRSFPDSWLAGEAHRHRADILEKLNRHREAIIEKQRLSEHYVSLPE